MAFPGRKYRQISPEDGLDLGPKLMDPWHQDTYERRRGMTKTRAQSLCLRISATSHVRGLSPLTSLLYQLCRFSRAAEPLLRDLRLPCNSRTRTCGLTSEDSITSPCRGHLAVIHGCTYSLPRTIREVSLLPRLSPDELGW